jgi:hypothetical protein
VALAVAPDELVALALPLTETLPERVFEERTTAW